MPPQPFVELPEIDPANALADREAIAKVNPQRFEFAQLDGIHTLDVPNNIIIGYRDIRDDEFWVRGHIPGRPLFPGVLMIEAAAQLVSYYVTNLDPEKGFIGFGGVDKVKFRGTVTPGQRIIFLGRMLQIRSRRCVGATQGFVDGQMVYEGEITGMWI